MTYRFSGIDHIQLAAPAGCEAQARYFFIDILGWEEIDKPEPLKGRGGVWFRCGSHQVHIGVQEPFHPAEKAHPAFEVVGLESLKLHIEGYGITIIEDEAGSIEGVDRFFMKDPFGNRIEFLEYRV